MFSASNHVCLFREFTRRLSEDPNYQSLLSQFKIEAMMIMEFNICLANNDGIPLEAFFSRRALLATANCAAIRQMLGLPDKRRMMEKLIDDMGLEHLGHIRYIEQQSGKFVDLWGDDMSHQVKRFGNII